jgi:hypothetical protein
MSQEKRPKKLLDLMRDVLQTQHHAIRTEDTYIDWAMCGPLSVCACGSKMWILLSIYSSSAMAKAEKIGSPCYRRTL